MSKMSFAPQHSPGEVVVYTSSPCPYCMAAKGLLRQRQIAFREVYIPWDGSEWDELIAATGMRTVPQIFHGDRIIGGYSDLAALDREDQLVSLRTR